MNLNIPKGFASVLSVYTGYFHLAIWCVVDAPVCVAVFKITHGDPSSQNSIEHRRPTLTYNVELEEACSADDAKKRQVVTHKVDPSQEKVCVVTYRSSTLAYLCRLHWSPKLLAGILKRLWMVQSSSQLEDATYGSTTITWSDSIHVYRRT
jgi:hypothetical protein